MQSYMARLPFHDHLQLQDRWTGSVGSTPQNFIEHGISRRGPILYNDQTDGAAGSDKTVRLNAVTVNVTSAKIMHAFSLCPTSKTF